MKAQQNPVKRAIIRSSRSNAIRAMCAHCMGCTLDQIEPGFRDSIRDCTSTQCPLFPFRPYQDIKGGASNLNAAIVPKLSKGIDTSTDHAEIRLAVGKMGAQI